MKIRIQLILWSLTVIILIVMIPDGFAADEIHWTIMGQTAVTFDWRGTNAEKSIAYGTSPGVYTNELIAVPPIPLPTSSSGPFWEAKITGLQEDTLYYYAIGNGAEHTFRTPPRPGDSDFIVYAEGDIGSTRTWSYVGDVQKIIADVYGNGFPDFSLLVGDLSYADVNGTADVDQHFNDVMRWSLDAAYMLAWGNHEWDKSSTLPDNFYDYVGRFAFPNAKTSPGTSAIYNYYPGEDWYWFDYGNVRFITYPEAYTSATWVDWNTQAKNVMAAAQADPNINYIVTFGHSPAYSSNTAGNSTLKGYLDGLALLYSKYTLNICGHHHDYERSDPSQTFGVTHIVTGTGHTNPSIITTTQPSWSVFRTKQPGALKLHFFKTYIEGEFICAPAGTLCPAAGAVLDFFTIGTPIVDTSSPNVSLTAPASGASVSGSIPITATASDNVGVAGVQFRLDGNLLDAEDTTSPYSISWNTNTAINGPHTLTAVARDAAGNATTSSPVSVTVNNPVDTGPPSVSITVPDGSVDLAGNVTVTANASDDIGVVGVQFRLDGNLLGAEDIASPYSISWNTTTATNGSHTLTAVARDAAGNATTSSPVSVTVNNPNPPPPGGGTNPTHLWRFDETSGTTAADSAGSNNATLTNITWVDGKTGTPIDKAVSFNGSNASGDAGKIDFGTGNFTVVHWVKVTGFKNFAGIFNNRSSASGNTGFHTRTDGTGSFTSLIDFGPTSKSLAVSNAAPETWYHLAVSVDRAGSMKLYVNGALSGQVDISAFSATSITNPDNVRLGRDQASNFFNGVLDDLRLYNSALSASEILNLYTGNAPANSAPTAAISQPSNGTAFSAGAAITFTGTATDNEDGNLTSSLNWTSSINGAIGSGGSFSTASLSAGTHTITASATDSGGLTGSASITVTVNAPPGNSAPTAAISQPANGTAFSAGAAITFTGTATDNEDGNLTSSLNWTSSINGAIGSGGSFSISSLSAGTHTITASVTDSGSLTGTASISVTVNAVGNSTPTADISAPADGAAFTAGDLISFSGTATDNEDGNLTSSLNWTSSINGAIGSGGSFSTASLSAGTHTITASVTDSGGALGSSSITLTVNPLGGGPIPVHQWQFDENTGTTAADTAGTNNANLTNVSWVAGKTGNAVAFNGTNAFGDAGQIDFGTGNFTVVHWVKVTSFNNYAGIFNNRSSASGNIGFHTRTDGTGTLKALIDFGASSRNIAITNAVPGTWYHVAVAVDRAGSMKLYVDGVLSGQVDISTFSATSLTNPDNVRLGRDQSSHYFSGAIDDLRLYNSALSDAEIQNLFTGNVPGNSAPTASISAPANGAAFTAGAAITFTGTASDTEDGDLTPALLWTSSLDGPIGSGGGFTTSTLSVGTHTITASATDSGSLTGTASISVTVNAVGNSTPTASISAPADAAAFTAGDPVAFTGTASDTEDGDLTASLTWTSSLDGPIGSGGGFTTSTLSVGTHTITASVTDSGSLTGSTSISVTVNAVGNSTPTASISAPANGAAFTEGDPVSFNGTASDTEDGDLTTILSWTSSLDGAIGTGGSFSTSSLSAGTHTITASVTDSGSLTGSASISVTVNAVGNSTPTASISAPVDGAAFTAGDLISFSGTASDAEDGDLTTILSWTSSLDGAIGTGGSFSISSLSAGTHTITASVTDSGSLTGSASISVTVNAVGNSTPTASISAPVDGAAFTAGDLISFSGTASDAEDGDLTTILSWTSSLDGAIGTGGSFSISSLSAGTHTITASATDSGSLTGSASISVTVNAVGNSTPTASISAPADGAAFTAGDPISFNGTASDAEDGDLTTALAWTSSIDGSIGSGGSFSISSLSAGTHTITASVTDSGGALGSSAITVTVVTPVGGAPIPAHQWQFDENTGTIAVDSTGTNNATLTNITWVDGKTGTLFDKAVSFNGTNSEGDAGQIDFGTGNFTVVHWVKVTGFKNFAGIFNNRSSASGNIGFHTRTDGTSTLKALIDFGATSRNIAITNAAPGIWYHVAVSVDRAGLMKLYVNGVLSGQVDISAFSATSLTNPDNVRLGRDQASNYFNGVMDDLRIYNSALSEAEILNLYNE